MLRIRRARCPPLASHSWGCGSTAVPVTSDGQDTLLPSCTNAAWLAPAPTQCASPRQAAFERGACPTCLLGHRVHPAAGSAGPQAAATASHGELESVCATQQHCRLPTLNASRRRRGSGHPGGGGSNNGQILACSHINPTPCRSVARRNTSGLCLLKPCCSGRVGFSPKVS